MRDYGKVHTSFWSSDTLAGLGDDARFLALYLLTCQHGNMIGCFRLPIAYAAEDTGWTSERLRNGFETLSASGWMAWDERASWVWVRKWMKWNPPANPNQWKAADKLSAQVPSSVTFYSEFASGETVSKPLNNTPAPAPAPVPVLEGGVEGVIYPAIPLIDGSDFIVPASLLAELRAAFPKVPLRDEMAKARSWCVANPAKRKTARGVAKFLHGWMTKAARDVAANTPAEPKRRLKEL